MSDALGSILNLLEVRMNPIHNRVPSNKQRRQIENLSNIIHGKKSKSGSSPSSSGSFKESFSPSSPRNFFLRRALPGSKEKEQLNSQAALSNAVPVIPDESIREFNVGSNPNRFFVTGGTVWQQVINPAKEGRDATGAIGPRTSGGGRYSYVKKNALLFSDVLLLFHVSEDSSIVDSVSSKSASNSDSKKKKGKQETPSPVTPSPTANSADLTREVNDGTDFGNIDLDDAEDLKALVKKGKLQLQQVIYVKSMKMYDLPPANADRSAWEQQVQPTQRSTTPVSNFGSLASESNLRDTVHYGRDSPIGGGAGIGSSGYLATRCYHRFEILYHLPYHDRNVTKHSRSIVICSQQKSILDRYREELRRIIVSYHMLHATNTIVTVDTTVAGSSNIRNSIGTFGTTAASAGTAPNVRNSVSSISLAGTMGISPPIQTQLKLGWLYVLFGGTIFEASYNGDMRALRNHLDHMSTYNGNFYGGVSHALSPTNIDLASKADIRGRTQTQDSAASATRGIDSGIGGTNLIINGSYYVDSLDNFGMTALHWACLNGHTVCARLLIDFGADTNVRQQRGGNTALIIACASGHPEIVSLLLHQGSPSNRQQNRSNSYTRIETRNYAGHNAVEMALFCSHVRLRRELSEAIANDASSSAKESIIMKEKRCLQQILSALYSHGANFNEEDATGNTPLYLCVYYNIKYGIEILMELLGQNTGGYTGSGNRPRGNTNGTIDESNATLRIQNSTINFNAVHPQHRCTPLQLACSRVLNVYDVEFDELHLGSLDIIRLLIAGGAYLNWRNKNASKYENVKRSISRNGTDPYGNADGTKSCNTSDSGGSRRNSRESFLSEKTSQTSNHYGSKIQEEEYDSNEERESYTYGRASDAGSAYGGSQGGQSSKYSSAKDSKKKHRSAGGSIGAWTPLQILQRTFVQVKLEEIELLNSTNAYSAGGAASQGGSAAFNFNQSFVQEGRVSDLMDFTMGSKICMTPTPTFYGTADHPYSVTPRSKSPAPVESPLPFQPPGVNAQLLFDGDKNSPGSQGSTSHAESPVDMATPASMPDGGDKGLQNPAERTKKMASVVFQAILVLIRSGAHWREKDLADTVKTCELPPKPTTRGSGYGSDRGSGYSSGGYGSGAERRSEHVQKHATAKKASKHHLLLTKPSLKYAVDECTDEWQHRNEPENFEEFVCSRQAMGDVLYQLKTNWQDDSDQNHCELCVKTFTSIGNRRHHCRCCGVLVCDRCSSKRLSLAVLPPSSTTSDVGVGVTKERTCDACFNQLCAQVDNSQSASNRYCVKQLKASAELLVEQLQHFLYALQQQVQSSPRKTRAGGKQSGKTRRNGERRSSRNKFGAYRNGNGSDSDSDYEGNVGSSPRMDRVTAPLLGTPPRERPGSGRYDDYERSNDALLFTPPKQTYSTKISRRRQSESGLGGDTRASQSSKNMFFCPGGSHHQQDGAPSSPVRLSLIENDVGLYKSLQHRHMIQDQVQVLLDCDYLAQAFLDASRMYQVEAESLL